MNIGADVVYAFRPTQRFAIEAKVGGGMTRFNPAPSLETNPAEADSPLGAHVAFGADFKYLTLMTNFYGWRIYYRLLHSALRCRCCRRRRSCSLHLWGRGLIRLPPSFRVELGLVSHQVYMLHRFD